ncbi:hypothetical protein GCM10007161_13590 [Ignatzschineria indica]|uniref:Uncharacterized protein n=1 Tax=Ignatzschineria indica TaxID=472583 RepID=A0A2U2AJM8_9GAMM|nr:hypothetical protein [Ignatzschineria indica]PWD83045.1 hypothetical protein DC082_06365 [Ignatzschineria indica]GGZ83353.1 hypothetical protein GCM10007161_13590 [Ignatzschineria indica]
MSNKRALYKWPERLPCPFMEYSYAPSNAFYRTKMESGRARHRRRSKSITTKVQVKWKIPRVDMKDFRFFVFELVGADAGWGFFLTPLLFDDEVKDMKARFTNPDNPFSVTNEENVLYIVTAELEVMELNLMQEHEFFERNADVFERAIDPLHELINEDMPEKFGE